MNVNAFLKKLNGVKETGPGQWQAKCPAHNDQKPSLSIKLDGDKILVHCHAGCSTKEIVRALGLTEADLFLKHNGKRIAAAYDYRNASGEPLFQVVRFEPKGFAQRHKANGHWEWGRGNAPLVLYRLPELLAADPDEPVFVVEGEKDADKLASLGLVATTNPGGAGKWKEEFTETLKSRRVVILPDNDDPGREHAQKVAQALCGKAASVKIVELPGLPSKGDVSDWLAQGGTKTELLKLAEKAPEYALEAKGLGRLVRWSEIEPEEVEWLWYPRIPLRKLTLISGDPGSGKTFLAVTLAAYVTRGGGWPDGPGIQEPAPVLYLSYEDGIQDTLRPRAEAAGANVSLILTPDPPPTFAEADVLRGWIHYLKPKLIVVDPIQAFVGSGVDFHRANEVRPVLAFLANLAQEANAAVVIVGHLSKGPRGTPLYRVLGSVDFTAAPRSVLLVGRDTEGEERRVLAVMKSSLAPEGEPLSFDIHEGRVRWLGSSDSTAADLLAPVEDNTAQAEAVEFLKVTLAEGPREAGKILDEAKRAGISERTLRRAKKKMKISATKAGTAWVWALPEGCQHVVGNHGSLQENIDSNYTSSWQCSWQYCQGLATLPSSNGWQSSQEGDNSDGNNEIGKTAKAANVSTGSLERCKACGRLVSPKTMDPHGRCPKCAAEDVPPF